MMKRTHPAANYSCPHVARHCQCVCRLTTTSRCANRWELLIQSAGWRPETFGSAQDFPCQTEDSNSELPGVDVGLPGLNGLDLQKRIARRSERHADHLHHGPRDVPDD